MTTADPAAIVDAFLASMAKLDYDDALRYVTDDVIYTNMPTGTVHGPAGIRGTLEPFFSPTIHNEWLISNVAVNGSTVFVERLDRHQLPGGWAELPVVGVFEVRDGKIAHWREYFDMATIVNGITAVSGA